MVFEKPKLLFFAKTERRRYFRRALWLLLAAVTAGAAWVVLDEAASRGVVDAAVVRVGQWVALAIIAIFFVRIGVYLYRGFTTRNETIRLYDRGLRWERGKTTHKYSWGNVKTYRDGTRALMLFGRPLLQWGALSFTMRDDKTFKITPRHGNVKTLSRRLDPVIADITGTRMGRALRENRGVRVHPKLALMSAGVVAGDQKIRWSQVDIQLKRGSLVVSQQKENGKFKPVKRYRKHQIDNLPGVLDVTDSIIRNHQPDRFGVRTYQANG